MLMGKRNRHPAVAVLGFGRCGSTAVMQMLHAGGWPPRGKVYLESMESLGDPNVAIAKAVRKPQSGTTVKMLDWPLRNNVPSRKVPWKVILLERLDREAQAESAIRFLHIWRYGKSITPEAQTELAESFRRDWPALETAARDMGPTLHLQFERILEDPERAAKEIDRFLPGPFNTAAAASVIRQPVELVKKRKEEA